MLKKGPAFGNARDRRRGPDRHAGRDQQPRRDRRSSATGPTRSSPTCTCRPTTRSIPTTGSSRSTTPTGCGWRTSGPASTARRRRSPTPLGTACAWSAARASGETAVYMDGSRFPLMTAVDKTFDSGRVGFGSFDNQGPDQGPRRSPARPSRSEGGAPMSRSHSRAIAATASSCAGAARRRARPRPRTRRARTCCRACGATWCRSTTSSIPRPGARRRSSTRAGRGTRIDLVNGGAAMRVHDGAYAGAATRSRPGSSTHGQRQRRLEGRRLLRDRRPDDARVQPGAPDHDHGLVQADGLEPEPELRPRRSRTTCSMRSGSPGS